jgi:hypothetical protein
MNAPSTWAKQGYRIPIICKKMRAMILKILDMGFWLRRFLVRLVLSLLGGTVSLNIVRFSGSLQHRESTIERVYQIKKSCKIRHQKESL